MRKGGRNGGGKGWFMGFAGGKTCGWPADRAITCLKGAQIDAQLGFKLDQNSDVDPNLGLPGWPLKFA